MIPARIINQIREEIGHDLFNATHGQLDAQFNRSVTVPGMGTVTLADCHEATIIEAVKRLHSFGMLTKLGTWVHLNVRVNPFSRLLEACIEFTHEGLIGAAISAGVIQSAKASLIDAADDFAIHGMTLPVTHTRADEPSGDLAGGYIEALMADGSIAVTTMSPTELDGCVDMAIIEKYGDTDAPLQPMMETFMLACIVRRAFKTWQLGLLYGDDALAAKADALDELAAVHHDYFERFRAEQENNAKMARSKNFRGVSNQPSRLAEKLGPIGAVAAHGRTPIMKAVPAPAATEAQGSEELDWGTSW